MCAHVYSHLPPPEIHLPPAPPLRHPQKSAPLALPLRPLKNLPPCAPLKKKGSNGTYITTRPERGNVAVVKSFIFLNNWLHCWSWG